MYFNSQYPSSGMNQMMGLNSTLNNGWNNPSMNPMGLNRTVHLFAQSYLVP